MRIRRSSTLGLALGLGLGLTSTARAYTRLDNGAGSFVAMPAGDVIIDLAHLPNAASFDPQALQQAVDTAISTWSEIEGLPLLLHVGAADDPVAKGTPVVSVIDQDKKWEHAPVLAVTALTSAAKTGVIMSAEMDINDVAFDFSTVFAAGEDDKKPEYDLATVLTHELGHALGLGHSTDKSAVMYPDIPPGRLGPPQLSADDRAGIAAIYAGMTLPQSSAPKSDGTGGATRNATQSSGAASPTATPGCSMATGGGPAPSGLLFVALCVAAAYRRRVAYQKSHARG